MIQTLCQPVSEELFARFKKIKLVLSDVDGVLSDGKIYLTESGDEIKSFNAKDGAGICSLRRVGVKFGVITGRKSNLVERRMKSLGVDIVYQGIFDKLAAFREILQNEGLKAEECLYIGDDVIDLPLLKNAGISVTVKDGHPLVLRAADLITISAGGEGAVREVTDLVLQSYGCLDVMEVSG